MPIYPFVGQTIPGLELWLVEVVTIDGKEVTVPALTTINVRDLGSINWRRERYLNGNHVIKPYVVFAL